MITRLVIASLFIAFAIVFTWPWIDTILLRHDATSRILDKLEAEWRKELDSTQPEDQWNW